MFLWAQGIDDNNGGVGRVRWAHGLSDDDVGVRRERGIYDGYEGLDTMAEVAGDIRRPQGIYNEDRGFRVGRIAKILQQRQLMRQRRIDNTSKGLKTTAEAAAD